MKAILKELEQQKGNPRVSIVISTELRSFADREKIRLKLKNHIDQAAKQLNQNYDEITAKKLTRALKDMAKKIDMNHLEKGIGLYVSPGFRKLVSYPFEVSNKVTVNQSFDTSEVTKTLNKMIDFSVLLLSKNKTRLFIGKGNKLEEIENEHFPMHFENEFQVHRSSPYSFYNGEESEIDQARLKAYFRKVDELLGEHTQEMPLVLCGVVKHLSEFKSISKHTKNIIGEFTGNYDKYSLHKVSCLVSPLIESL